MKVIARLEEEERFAQIRFEEEMKSIRLMKELIEERVRLEEMKKETFRCNQNQ